jgi:lactate dehydrogenase-like 2-hydroxyacid dehydrogenase
VARTCEKVVIADYDYGDVDIERAIIEPAGFELIAAQCKTEEEVIEVAHAAAAVVAQYATISARVIAELSDCRVIARYGTGVDIIDVDAATRHNILVTNVPSDWCENEVADHAMALLLAVARKISVYDRATRGGTWPARYGARAAARVRSRGRARLGSRRAVRSEKGHSYLSGDAYRPSPPRVELHRHVPGGAADRASSPNRVRNGKPTPALASR